LLLIGARDLCIADAAREEEERRGVAQQPRQRDGRIWIGGRGGGRGGVLGAADNPMDRGPLAVQITGGLEGQGQRPGEGMGEGGKKMLRESSLVAGETEAAGIWWRRLRASWRRSGDGKAMGTDGRPLAKPRGAPDGVARLVMFVVALVQ
jgi:hypothetical protein